MNTLDAAIKGLRDTRHAVIAEQRQLEKRLRQLDTALKALGVSDDLPRGVNGGSKINYPLGPEQKRRRDVLDLYVETRQPGEEITGKQLVVDCGEPYSLIQSYRDLIRKDPRLECVRRGVYRVRA